MYDANSSDNTLIEEKVSPIIISAERNTITKNSNLTLKIANQIAKAKESIVRNENNSEVGHIRPIIRESWLRSYHRGLKLYDFNYGPIVDKPEFENLLHKKSLLVKASIPYIRKLADMCKKSMILLSDEQGVMLHVEVDKNGVFYKTIEDLHLFPGVVWSEETVGTLSHSISLIYQIPIQLSGPEQYHETYYQYTASAAPIMDINNNLAGTITLVTNDLIFQNTHTLPLIVSIAKGIEKELHLISNQELFGRFIETTDQGIVLLNRDGRITHANPQVCKILNRKIPEIAGMTIYDIIGDQPRIKSLLETGNEVNDFEIKLKEINQNTYLSSAKPLDDHYGNRIGYSLVFKNAATFTKKVLAGSTLETKYRFDKIVGNSSQFLQAISLAKKFAKLDYNILIQGESGTGKELFAQAIHNEHCPNGPFVAINCAAIPKNLIESELFGYEAGAFTGADRQGRKGKIELADGGTLFLDEIGDMSLELQPALLRVLEEKQVMRIGGSSYKPVNFRLIAATNQVLSDLVDKKVFREDLYYRLEALQVAIPPLREREQDILELAEYFIANIAEKQQIARPSLSEATIYRLMQYSWPGNVRQLQNAMVYAVNASNNNMIRPEDLPPTINKSPYSTQHPSVSDPTMNDTKSRNSIKDVEKMMIIQAIVKTNNNIAEAARLLGMSKSSLYKKIKKTDLLKEIRSI
ncbi:sigma 54-interacting transcriptional regulator [Dehalobacter sp. DCM]|uniref:sigma-54-dependent Fis family transcriptional regulator n=1 Tax=Dehalobacter sp. DCM TaxID=2907827 RepID=UPI00308133AB|nr:sigma 54-interacting transcriptional regulator [Dehalobacter sp. DCM]